MDSGLKLDKTLFPDSYMALKLSCGRSKSEDLILSILGPNALENVLHKKSQSKDFFYLSRCLK